ncbi:YtxH domain-containing protein [Cellulomonas shaoxiangyii]|uniref:YtxH domain-containing protein n=1 Tax=Cellulomonas shaoxiangyii TaxID=2566013 RepID=UPI001FB7A70C|nr:YtxH domain-containing protein [Cellulomonas shaoxiangyii]
MKGKLTFLVGAGVGYLLGTRAGRQQFEKIKGWATETWQDPRVQGYVKDAESAATDFAKTQGGALKEKAVSTAKSAFHKGDSDESADEPTSETSYPQTSYPQTDGPLVDADDANPNAPKI